MFPALWKFGLQLLPWTSYFSNVGPTSCFTHQLETVTDLAHCLDGFTVLKETYTSKSYASAQPTPLQLLAWKDTVNRLLSVDNLDCANVMPEASPLAGIYAIRRFHEYCVLHEITSTDGVYDKGWGFMVVPALKSLVRRHVHISAPHPKFDARTIEQAAAIFWATGSKSLLVAGRHRNAYVKVSDCVPQYNVTDPVHNIVEPFSDAMVKIHDWQVALDGCPTASCAFLQFHGNAGCPRPPLAPVTVFLSAGLGTPPSAPLPNWYTDSVDRPVKRIQANAIRLLPSNWTIKLPSQSSCDLTASKNIGGRYINNIPSSDVCIPGRKAVPANTTGKFVHIEQTSISRNPAYHALWAQVVADSFQFSPGQ